jgi:hypothetical protein
MSDTQNPLQGGPSLGIRPGDTVRLIGGSADIGALLAPLPDGVTVTSLASESANVGVIVIDDELDLRERLFTELDGLLGATHVWILTHHGTGPTVEQIATETDIVHWRTNTTQPLADAWTAVSIQHN